MDAIKNLQKGVYNAMANRMYWLGQDIARDMRANLIAGGHVDTGNLLASIRSETEVQDDKVVTTVYADAKSVDGAQYAEFIEKGTGAAHGRAGGRVGSWSYMDRHGKWHTTDGMDADPFIEPALDAHVGEWVDEVVKDIEKYARLKGGA